MTDILLSLVPLALMFVLLLAVPRYVIGGESA